MTLADSMLTATPESLTLLPPGAHDLLESRCTALGIPSDGTTVLLPGTMLDWARRIRRCGGLWRLLPGGAECSYIHNLQPPDDPTSLDGEFDSFTWAGEVAWVRLEHKCGFMTLELDGLTFLLAGLRTPPVHRQEPEPRAVCVLTGQTASAQRTALSRLMAPERPGNRVMFWDGDPRWLDVPPVSEEEVILDAALKRPLLEWLDSYWNHQEAAAELGLPVHRGLLLLGAPGNGKTNLIRHLLTRFPDREAHLFVATAAGRGEDAFRRMLGALQRPGKPKIVVLEDIDHLQTGGVPQAHLLNVLDGLLRGDSSVLWIATSNDPGELALNLLDRPGRFDRIVVFPEPGPAERAAMVRLFSRGKASDEDVRIAAAASDGFSGAHLREACSSAVLAHLANGGEYGQLLSAEIRRLGQHHMQAQTYFREVSGRRVGFLPAK
jgi:hypothetical protein